MSTPNCASRCASNCRGCLRQSGATVLYVTQDYKEAMALGDRIAVLAEGRFVQVGTPEDIYLRPATLGVAKLFGDPSINTIETKVSADGTLGCGPRRRCPDRTGASQAFAGRDVIFGVRPEAIAILRDKPGLPATVVAVTPLNERVVLLLQSEGGWEFLASLPSATANVPEPDTQVTVNFAPEGIHLFDRETGERLHG